MDRVTYVIARLHAQRVYRGFERDVRDAVRVQERVLLAKLRRNADSDFGRQHRFASIRTSSEFRKALPVGDYERHRPWIERVKNGEAQALFGPGQRVHMFALTSGTTEQPKYIPVTGAFLDEYRRGWNAFGIKALLDHPAAFLRGIAQVTSRMDEACTPSGVPCGAITGLMAATQKRLVRKYYVTPRELALIDDPAAKYYTVMRLAVPTDVAFVITASPATQLKLARTAEQHAEQLIRDVRDGTLRDDLDIPAEVRRSLAHRLKPDRKAGGRLERLASERGRLLPRDYWNLAFLANWTGGTMGLYLADFPEYFGDVPVRDIGLLASEGRVSIPVQDGTPAGILDVASHFFEFIPQAAYGQPEPPTLLAHELEPGREYFVVLTTSSGLYRYDLGDLVRVVGHEGQAPLLEFLGKGSHICSLAGEKLTEHQVVLAMQSVCGQLACRLDTFVLAPRWGRPPGYVLNLEPPAGQAATWLGDLAGALDQALCQVNIEYRSRRLSDRLAALTVNPLPAGFLAELDRERAARYRRSNEQYKHQYLYSRPEDAANFPTAL